MYIARTVSISSSRTKNTYYSSNTSKARTKNRLRIASVSRPKHRLRLLTTSQSSISQNKNSAKFPLKRPVIKRNSDSRTKSKFKYNKSVQFTRRQILQDIKSKIYY